MTIKRTLFLLTAAAIGLTSCQTKPAETKGGPSAFEGDTLSYKVAKAYVKNYEKHAGTIDSIDTSPGSNKVVKLPNTRAIWFSAGRLDSLVSKIKKEKGDGIRFYLATYDTGYKEDVNSRMPDKKYWGYNTLVMVSTKDSLGKYHQDYYKNTSANGPASGFIVGATPENRGEMCPPPRDCTGATLLP